MPYGKVTTQHRNISRKARKHREVYRANHLGVWGWHAFAYLAGETRLLAQPLAYLQFNLLGEFRSTDLGAVAAQFLH